MSEKESRAREIQVRLGLQDQGAEERYRSKRRVDFKNEGANRQHELINHSLQTNKRQHELDRQGLGFKAKRYG